MEPSSSLSCASPILRRPHSVGDFPFFHPSNRTSKYPAPFSPTTTCLFSGDCRGAKEILSAFRIYNRGIHVDSSRACRTVHSSALVTPRSWAGHSLCSDFRTQKVAASNERHLGSALYFLFICGGMRARTSSPCSKGGGWLS